MSTILASNAAPPTKGAVSLYLTGRRLNTLLRTAVGASVQTPPGVDVLLIEAPDLEGVSGPEAVVYEPGSSPEGLSIRLGARSRA